LELGSGTGLLAILLSPLCGSYTASDLLVNLQLCARNLELNGVDVVEGQQSMEKSGNTGVDGRRAGVAMEEIDWFDSSASDIGSDYDLILAIDCVYNEALAIPLVNTMSRYCRVGSPTIALVVVELRSSDVVSTSP
jgi:predicted nicotinamide N-methyase